MRQCDCEGCGCDGLGECSINGGLFLDPKSNYSQELKEQYARKWMCTHCIEKRNDPDILAETWGQEEMWKSG